MWQLVATQPQTALLTLECSMLQPAAYRLYTAFAQLPCTVSESNDTLLVTPTQLVAY